MTPQMKAIIIGWWRMGASIEEIIGATGVSYMDIKNTIETYVPKP